VRSINCVEPEGFTNTIKKQTMSEQIDKTDKETDGMVYELYELSEEEIRIVEGV